MLRKTTKGCDSGIIISTDDKTHDENAHLEWYSTGKSLRIQKFTFVKKSPARPMIREICKEARRCNLETISAEIDDRKKVFAFETLGTPTYYYSTSDNTRQISKETAKLLIKAHTTRKRYQDKINDRLIAIYQTKNCRMPKLD